MKYLFENLVATDEIYLLIEQHCPDETERDYIFMIIKDTIHHKVVDLILDELDEEKRLFVMTNIDNVHQHENLLRSLSEWIEDFELKVLARIKETEKELIELIS